jgi:tetratricopeptide (TPR) repeat protein
MNCYRLRNSALIVITAFLIMFASPLRLAAQKGQEKLTAADKLYNDGNFEAACQAYGQLNSGDDDVKKHLSAACLAKADRYDIAERLFQEGLKLKKDEKCDEALQQFQQSLSGGQKSEATGKEIPLKAFKHKAEVESYLKEGCTAEELRLGLKAYLSLRYDEANNHLSKYIDKNGPQRDLALFFRGAVHGSRFLLSGETDTHSRDSAFQDFKLIQSGFSPNEKLISPRIMDLYKQARGSPPS